MGKRRSGGGGASRPVEGPGALSEIVEGATRLLVPKASLGNPAPPTSPVFFNEAAMVNRDVSVAVAEASSCRTFCDAMAGVGSRGVRVAKEARGVEEVTLVDFNPSSLQVARRSARLNGVEGMCSFVGQETCAFLSSRFGRDKRYDAVDVDPFGSPARYLTAATSATADGGMLSLTATDTAALCGVYPSAARRRYGATPLNNHFHHETAVRILLGALGRAAAAMEIGVSPVAAHSTRHYVRVYARLSVGARRADASLENEGYVSWCPACGETAGALIDLCPACGGRMKAAGPLWAGPLTEPATVRRAAEAAEKAGRSEAARVLRALDGVDGFPPWGYSIERVCSSLKLASVPEWRVREALAGAGFRSMRQPFEERGIKTDAPASALVDAVRAAARASG